MTEGNTAVSILDDETLKSVDLFLEEFYRFSPTAGEKMAEVDLSNAQVRGLETLIGSTSRFSEILNFIKSRAGKDTRNTWSQVAEMLIGQLESLEQKANELASDDPAKAMEIKLRLARGWSNQVVSQFFYSKKMKEDEVR